MMVQSSICQEMEYGLLIMWRQNICHSLLERYTDKDAVEIFDGLDATKVRSCMTLLTLYHPMMYFKRFLKSSIKDNMT